MTRTPKHRLAFEGSGQGLKDNLNDFLKVFDSLSHPLVLDKDLTAPPGGESEGDTYIVAATATGAWAGQENDLAVYYYGRWMFVTPWKGLTVHVDDETTTYAWTGSAWRSTSIATVVQSRTALKGLDYSYMAIAYLAEAGRQGTFVWDATVPIATHQEDTAEGVYVAPDAGSNGAWKRVFFGAPIVTWFGATGDGTTNDAPAIQAAADAFAALGFPVGRYLVKDQITLSATHDPRSWIGLGGSIPSSKSGPGPTLVYHSDLGSAPMVVNEATTWFSHIGFDGAAKGTGVAVRNRRDTASGEVYEDTDSSFVACHFSDWDVAIEHYNRGLLIQICSIQLCESVVELFWDDVNFVDNAGNPYDAVELGYRAIRIENNRMHAVTSCVRNTGTDNEYLRGLHLCNNTIDIGDALFHGGLAQGLIASNVIDQTSAAVGAIRITSACDGVSIVSNSITGDTEQAEPSVLIQFDGEVDNLNLSSNTLRRASQYGVNFAAAVRNSTLSANTIAEIGTAGQTTRACIRFQSTATETTISASSLKPRTDAYGVRGSSGQAWTGVTIQANSWDRDRLLWGVFADGGNNNLQYDNALLTIADDAVAGVTPPQIGGVASVSVNPYSAFPSPTTTGVVLYDVGTSDDVIKVGGGADLEVSSGALAGTTGNDTKVTVGVSGGQIQIENRTGASAQVLVKWL